VTAKWQRCQRCRKVLAAEEFEGGSEVCRADAVLTGSTPAARSSRAGGVVTTRIVAPAERSAARDIRGRGDAEVRARRARTRALDRLAERHPEDYGFYLREERAAEGL
jgi:hypothetical protein